MLRPVRVLSEKLLKVGSFDSLTVDVAKRGKLIERLSVY